MILNETQLTAAIHGWVDRETIDGYTFFYRFTEKQRNYYANTHFVTKERASASIYMEFVTDAEGLGFEFIQQRASSQNFYFFDLYVNGKMIFHDGNASYDGTEESSLFRELPAGEKTVRVNFPNLSATGLRNVELKNATIFRPTEKKLRYVAYGDSITQGYTAKAPSLSYVNLVGEALNADVYNLGIGGEFFQPLMTDDAYPVKADLVTVAYGTNDWGHVTPEEDAVRRKEFFDALCRIHEGAKIFVLLPIWRGQESVSRNGYGTLEDYRNILREDLKKYPRITPVEGADFVPHHEDFFMPDVLHPNALGFTQYAKNLLTELKKHL